MADNTSDRSDTSSKLAADITIAWLQNPNVNPGVVDVSRLLQSVLSTFNDRPTDLTGAVVKSAAKAAASKIAVTVPTSKLAPARTKIAKKPTQKTSAGGKAAKESAKGPVPTPQGGIEVPIVVSPTTEPATDQVVTASGVTKAPRAAARAKAVPAETIATPESKGATPRVKARKSAADTDAIPPKSRTPAKGKAATKTASSNPPAATDVAAVDPSGVALARDEPVPPAAPQPKRGAAKPRRMARAPKADTTLADNVDGPSNEKPSRKAKVPASPVPAEEAKAKQSRRTRKAPAGQA
ncbi:MAG: hypothetical protein KGJ57_10585 [Sphingomonadales bacterium]|nr:hypothetical protein [Sphingomonadales bacterium]MDE2169860.1 hypothetical protein [Sphingomonadales bacterium]